MKRVCLVRLENKSLVIQTIEDIKRHGALGKVLLSNCLESVDLQIIQENN